VSIRPAAPEEDKGVGVTEQAPTKATLETSTSLQQSLPGWVWVEWAMDDPGLSPPRVEPVGNFQSGDLVNRMRCFDERRDISHFVSTKRRIRAS
jgi:hypothetical protein